MTQTDTPLDHADWTSLGLPVTPTSQVVINAGCFEGLQGELVKKLGTDRALVRLQQGVLLEIDSNVLASPVH